MKRESIWVLIGLQLHTGFVLAANPSLSELSTPSKLGIIQIADLDGELKKAYPILEQRIRRWIENSGATKLRVEHLHGAVSSWELDQTKRVLELLEIERRLDLAPAEKELRQESDRFIALKRSLATSYWANPILQRISLQLSSQFLRARDTKSAKIALVMASDLHPSGELVFTRSESGDFDIGLEAFAETVLAPQRRSCQVRVLPPHSGMKIFANGFAISDQALFTTGKLVRIWGELNGRITNESLVSCVGTSSLSVKLGWPQTDVSNQVPLRATETRTANSDNFHSFILVSGYKKRFKLFLFTPMKAFDEIPLEIPLTLSFLSGTVGETEIPVVNRRWDGILSKHQLIASNDSFAPFPKDVSQNLDRVSEPLWLKSPVFWSILGGVLASGAIIYLMNQNHDGVGSQNARTDFSGRVN